MAPTLAIALIAAAVTRGAAAFAPTIESDAAGLVVHIQQGSAVSVQYHSPSGSAVGDAERLVTTSELETMKQDLMAYVAQTVGDALKGKAEQAAVDSVADALKSKADASQLDTVTATLSGKADTDTVEALLKAKASSTEVAAMLKGKLDTSALDAALGSKADKADVAGKLDSSELGAAKVVADFRADFQGPTPKTGWKYLANFAGPVGKASAYEELVWATDMPTGPRYMKKDGEGSDKYIRVTKDYSRPGQTNPKDIQAGKAATATIAAYTIQADGFYSLQSGVVRDIDARGCIVESQLGHCDFSVDVLVNDATVFARRGAGSTTVVFSPLLGQLKTGDVVYVAVGQGRDGGSYDQINLDFQLVQGVRGALDALRMSAPDVDKTMFRRSVAQFPKDLALGKDGTPPYGWRVMYAAKTVPASIIVPWTYKPMTWQKANNGQGQQLAGLRYQPNYCSQSGALANCGFSIFMTKDGNGHNTATEFPAIMYTVEENGLFSITDSKFTSYTKEGDGNRVFVYVDGIKKYEDVTVHTTGDTNINFNCDLGYVVAGQKVAVIIGSNGNSAYDSFKLQFSVGLGVGSALRSAFQKIDHYNKGE